MFLACRRGNQPDFAHITFDWEGTINRLPCEHITSFLSHGKNKEKSLSITIQRSTRINEIQHKHMQYGVHMDQKQMQRLISFHFLRLSLSVVIALGCKRRLDVWIYFILLLKSRGRAYTHSNASSNASSTSRSQRKAKGVINTIYMFFSFFLFRINRSTKYYHQSIDAIAIWLVLPR